MSARIELDELNVWLGTQRERPVHAVRDVSLCLEAGESVALLGESGCGKTTTALAIMGLLPASAAVSGRILLDGEDILAGGEATMRPHRARDIALVFQGAMNALNPVLRVGGQIGEAIRLHEGVRGAALDARVRESLAQVELGERVALAYPHELSGGMKQRACIALALACKPAVVIADEPTTSLDVLLQGKIVDLLVSLTRSIDAALLLVTHDLPLALTRCDRAGIMYAGEIVEHGSAAALAHAPQHPYTARLLDAVPQLGEPHRPEPIPGRPPSLRVHPPGCSFAPRCTRAIAECHTERPPVRSTETGWASCVWAGDQHAATARP